MVNPTVTPGSFNYGIRIENWVWTKGKGSYTPLVVISAVSKLDLLPLGLPQDQVRVSDGEANSQALQLDRKPHRKVSVLHPVSWPFINSSKFTFKIPSKEQNVSLWTLKCVTLPEMQHNKGCRRYQHMNHGAHLMEAKKNVAVLLLEGWHDTQTYTLPFLAGIQPKQMQGSSQQKGGEHTVSAVNWSYQCASASAAAGP